MTSRNSLSAALDLQHPIIQAPMAGVSTPELAAAVSNAGGLGSIAVGAASVDTAAAMIAKTRALTDRPFNVNVFCHAPARADAAREQRWLDRLAPEFARFDAVPPSEVAEIYTSFLADPAMQQLLISEAPAVVSFHFGLPPQPVIADLRAAGCRLLASVTNLEEARLAEGLGIDALVVQGIEAGGHRGCFDPDASDEELPMLDLLRQLADHSRLPLIAAGGLMDGADCARALAAGAALVQLGTAFVLCPESAADAGYRAALQSDLAQDTALTRVISGRPARGLRNRFSRWGEDIPGRQVPDYPRAYDAGKALHGAAKAQGEHGYGAHWAGSGAPRARALPAADLVAELAEEIAAVRHRL